MYLDRPRLAAAIGRRRRRAAGDSGPTALFHDTFNRANGALGTSDSGHEWTTHAGTVNVASNKFTASAASSVASVDAGIADFTSYAGDIAVGSEEQSYIAFRVVDGDDYLLAGFQAISTTVSVFEVVGGGFGAIGSFAAAARGRLEVRNAVGVGFEIYLDDELIIDTESANHVTATRYGGFGSNCVLDNVELIA